MGLSSPYFPKLCWNERFVISSYLEVADLEVFSKCSRGCYFGAKRELDHRVGRHFSSATFIPRSIKCSNVLIVSYPRSGNSLLRRRLESATGLATGSDTRPNRTLSRALLRCGFLGEGVVDESVCMIKSHYPERIGYARFTCARVILLVRNPFDAIESYFQMGFTNTHDRTLEARAKESLMHLYGDFAASEAQVWRDFHSFWLERSRQIPVEIIRFEDLVSDHDGAIVDRVKAFILSCLKAQVPGAPDPCLGPSHAALSLSSSSSSSITAGYIPRNGGVGRALTHMPGSHAATILHTTQDMMARFGYTVEPKEGGGGGGGGRDATGSAPFTLQVGTCPFSSRDPTIGTDPGRTEMVNGDRLACVRKTEALNRFGRGITELRRSYTKNDLEPFALVPR